MICLIASMVFATSDATLANGVRLRAIATDPLGVVSVQAFVRLGSVDDVKPGTAHLLEHMLFRRNLALDKKAEAVGGELNATTFREFMRFEFRGPKESVMAGIECIDGLLAPPQFDAATLAIEKKVIAEEIALRTANLAASTSASLWAKGVEGTPYALSSMGVATALDAVSASDVMACYGKHMVGAGVAVTVTGDVDSVSALGALKNKFGKLKSGKTIELPKFEGHNVDESPSWAFSAPGFDKPKEYAATSVLIDTLSRELGPAVTFEFGPSARGSLAIVIAEPEAVAKLKAALSAKLAEQDVHDAIARVAKRFENPVDASQTGLLNGIGLLFGIEDLPKLLAASTRQLLTSDVQTLADKWLSAVGK